MGFRCRTTKGPRARSKRTPVSELGARNRLNDEVVERNNQVGRWRHSMDLPTEGGCAADLRNANRSDHNGMDQRDNVACIDVSLLNRKCSRWRHRLLAVGSVERKLVGRLVLLP